jgi:catechol 1,2-dioxygenase
VFGVKSTLIAPFERLTGAETLWHSPFDFVLTPE